MHKRTVHEHGGLQTIVAVLDSGDEVVASLTRLAAEEGLTAASLTAIGALSSAELRYFDWQAKEYQPIPVAEQVEVASMIGDIAAGEDGRPALHIHCVLGRRDGSAVAGHLGSAKVRPTLEVVIVETPAHLMRRHDPQTGLLLIRP